MYRPVCAYRYVASALEEEILRAPKAATIIPCCATLCRVLCKWRERKREYRFEQTREAEYVRAPLYIVRFVGRRRHGVWWLGRNERNEGSNSLKTHHSTPPLQLHCPPLNIPQLTPENHSAESGLAFKPNSRDANEPKGRKEGKVQAYLSTCGTTEGDGTWVQD
jgi:hypothetical protein